MKKILFTTTALVMTAGAAAAEVSVSGHAEMGVFGGTGMETQFLSSVDVRFTMTGETDGGLTFGATVDADDLVDMGLNGNDPINQGTGELADYTVFISGAFGTVTIGDTDGGFDWGMGEVALAGGSLDDSETVHAGYNGNAGLDGTHDGQVLRYNNTFGDFGVAVSVEMDDTGVAVEDTVLGFGVRYSAALGGVDLDIGAGYQTNGVNDIYGISLIAAMGNGFSAGVNYSDLDGALDGNGVAMQDHIGIGVAYTMDALTIAANYGEYGSGADGYSLVANYDLGGGATVQFGYGSGTDSIGTNAETYSLGVAMSF